MKNFFDSIGNWFLDNWRPIVKVALIVVLGFLIVKIILAIIKRQLRKTKLEKTVQTFICSILKFVLYLILIFCIISSLGVSVTGLTVVISAVSLAISLALQDSLKNLVNGFVIISTGLIKQGDWVKIGSEEGSVQDVRMLYTVLVTSDNKRITIPNSSIIGSTITNYNVLQNRRLDFEFDIAYDSNVDLAKQVVFDVINSCEMVYENPAPSVVLSKLGESSITLTAKVWCSSGDYWNTKWYIIDNVFNEFKRNNICIPFNQLEVALVDPNKKSYVRQSAITKKDEHKAKIDNDEDIITTINKQLKKGSKFNIFNFKKKKDKKANQVVEEKKEEKPDEAKDENK